jgi:hypothetical protein
MSPVSQKQLSSTMAVILRTFCTWGVLLLSLPAFSTASSWQRINLTEASHSEGQAGRYITVSLFHSHSMNQELFVWTAARQATTFEAGAELMHPSYLSTSWVAAGAGV